MKRNIYNILILSLILFFSGFFGFIDDILAYNDRGQTCYADGICGRLIDDLPDGATGIEVDTNVKLLFLVYRRADEIPPVCEGNRKLFYAVKYNNIRSGDDYVYINPGEGNTFEYQFNSKQYGERHRYRGVFYCLTKLVVGNDGGQYTDDKNRAGKAPYQSDLLGSLPGGQVWFTPLFDQTTRVAPKLPVAETKKSEITTTVEKKVSWNFPNPLRAENLGDLIEIIMKWLRIIVIPTAVIVIVVSGIVMMYAGADAGKFNSAKKALLWAVVGLAVILIGEGFTKLIESIIELKNR